MACDARGVPWRAVVCCDGCDTEYHLKCLQPPLAAQPRGEWYCNSCEA
ncbi:unnamed protein product, partial [Phaeothamnion confervicola]